MATNKYASDLSPASDKFCVLACMSPITFLNHGWRTLLPHTPHCSTILPFNRLPVTVMSSF